MSNKYGYVGKDVPTQSFGSNKGVLNTDDLYELSNAGKLTQYGQLELIETQTVSGTPSTLSFDSIQESKYNVHFMTISEFQPQTDNRHLALRFKTGGVTDSNFNYKYAMQRNTVATSAELISGNDSKIWLAYNCSNISNETTNGYIYIYNAGDSSKYTFITTQFMMIDKDTNHSTNYQSSVYDITNVVNGIEFATSGDPLEYGTFSLYGIRYS